MKKFLFLLFLALSVCARAQQPGGNQTRLEIPGVKGVLQLDVGATPWSLEFSAGGWVNLHAGNRPDGVIISAKLSQVQFQANSETCRKESWPRLKRVYAGRLSDLQESSKDGVARTEFVFNGTENTTSRHLIVYWGARDLCAEAHLLKVGFAAPDQKLFDQVVASVRLLPDESGLHAPGSPNSTSSYMAEGAELYAMKKYADSAPYYEKALELEKRKRTIDEEMFRELISRLEFAYRQNNQPAKASDTIEYGLSKDPEFPVFHYELACAYAELGKAEPSLEHLRLMYKYQDKAGKHGLPEDPLQDDCFHKFASDEKFVKAVRAMDQH